VEEALLRAAGVALDDFRRGRGETEGGRRAYRIRLEGVSVEEAGTDLVLAFTLPRGSYATVVLDEVMKLDAD
jgi:tRNA pseudouridine13 synthase